MELSIFVCWRLGMKFKLNKRQHKFVADEHLFGSVSNDSDFSCTNNNIQDRSTMPVSGVFHSIVCF